jgi:hypothetical protein
MEMKLEVLELLDVGGSGGGGGTIELSTRVA